MAKPVQGGMTPAQQNQAARNLIIQTAIDEWQQIFQSTFTTGAGTVINVPLRNVGLVKRLLVKVAATVSGTSGTTLTLSTLGLANFFSNVTVTDLSNQTRVNTTGWHLTMVNSAKAREPYGQAVTQASTDSPIGYGANFTNVQYAPTAITNTVASNNVYHFLEIPLAYSDYDLRGAIYANVVNATFNLQLTVNSNLSVVTGADATFAVYSSSTSTLATLPSFTITVYQNYLDQLPVVNGQVVLPYADLGVAYLFNQTNFSGLVASTDNPFFYANFRDFMSTCIIYDNAGTLTTNGTDINYFALQTANYTNILKVDPTVPCLWNRLRMRQDMPKGCYYIDHRKKPISTIQYGNQALVINPATVTSNASAFYFGYEMLANIAQISNAGALPGT